MKQDLREALPKVRNPPSFTLREEKTTTSTTALLSHQRITYLFLKIEPHVLNTNKALAASK